MNYLSIIFLLAWFFSGISCTPPVQYRKGWMFSSGDRGKIVQVARRYIGVRYKSGGTTPDGFDCSGYAMYVYKKSGLNIPRTTTGQFYHGKRVSLGLAEPGDLVFFQTSRRVISHVGIYLGNHRFIHAPRTGKSVSVASIENSYWKNRYRGTVSYIRNSKRYASRQVLY